MAPGSFQGGLGHSKVVALGHSIPWCGVPGSSQPVISTHPRVTPTPTGGIKMLRYQGYAILW